MRSKHLPDDDELVTHRDLREAIEVSANRTIDQLTAVIGDALQLIAERFDKQDRKFEAKFDQVFAILHRMESKLDATNNRVDNHEVRIRRLERRPV